MPVLMDLTGFTRLFGDRRGTAEPADSPRPGPTAYGPLTLADTLADLAARLRAQLDRPGP